MSQERCETTDEVVTLLVLAGLAGPAPDYAAISPDAVLRARTKLAPARIGSALDGLKSKLLIIEGDTRLVEGFPEADRPTVWCLRWESVSRAKGNLLAPAMVYLLYGADNQLLYVGATIDHTQRFISHLRTKEWWPEVARAEVTWYDSQWPAQAAEQIAIRQGRPKYNRSGNPDWRGKDGARKPRAG